MDLWEYWRKNWRLNSLFKYFSLLSGLLNLYILRSLTWSALLPAVQFTLHLVQLTWFPSYPKGHYLHICSVTKQQTKKKSMIMHAFAFWGVISLIPSPIKAQLQFLYLQEALDSKNTKIVFDTCCQR